MMEGLRNIVLYGDWMNVVPDVTEKLRNHRIDGQMQKRWDRD